MANDNQDGSSDSFVDKRKKRYETIPHEFCVKYGPLIGPYGFSVYMSICMFAGAKQEAWPAQKTIAKQWDISRSTVRRSLRKLEEVGLIKIESRLRADGGITSSTYILLDYEEPAEQKSEEGGPSCHTGRSLLPHG